MIRKYRVLATGLVLLILSGVAPVEAATEEGYATGAECHAETNRSCWLDEEVNMWFPIPDDKSTGSGTFYNDDMEFIRQSNVSMPLRTSGTWTNPVVAVDFQQVVFPDVQPMLDRSIGRVRVPIRFVSEKMGANVQWTQETQTVTISHERFIVTLQVDNPTAYVNGEARTIDAAPILYNDRVLVPLRFISEMFGATVDWIGDTAPEVDKDYLGRFQVWIWVPWGYWGTTSMHTRLDTFVYRRD